MLIALAIQNFVIIENLEIQLEAGFSVLTGETGAGKSILLDALGIALGRRGEAGLIRKGADQAVVAAEFRLSHTHKAWKILEEQGIPSDGGILIRRILTSNGRSRAFINDQPVSLALLRQLGDLLLEIHGQFDRLLDVSQHRTLLDAFIRQPDLIRETGKNFEKWHLLKQAYGKERDHLEHLKRHEDFLKFQLQEFKNLNLLPDEEEQLLKERQQLAHLGRLWEVVQQALQAIQGTSSVEALQVALKTLQRAQGVDNIHVTAATQSFEKAVSELTEAVSQLEEIQEKIQGQPERLQRIDDRLHALRSAARKHNITVDQLLAYFERLQQDLANLSDAEERLQDLAWQADQAKQAYYQQAKSLYHERIKGAERLDAQVMMELPELYLPNARFMTAVKELPEDQWHEYGVDRINFLVAMNKGQDLCPLEKAASGGELARLMLALKAVLAVESSVSTIIFDEIDVGVGGAVAAAIGDRLSRMAHHVQVLSITHSPQVAATADHHFHVTKQDLASHMLTQVTLLPLERRSEEIARMLAGAEVTNEARAAAHTLLKRYNI